MIDVNRYNKRQLKRQTKKENFLNSMPKFEDVFTFANLKNAFDKCAEGVMWKPSVQKFKHELPFQLIELLGVLYSDKGFRSKGFIEFTLNERGKEHKIKSVEVRERVVQRCLCDHFLIPLLSRGLEYDNGASLKDKGTSFALRRIKEHLRRYYNKYGTNEGYILLYDFSNYFGNIDHQKLYEIVDPLFRDVKLQKLYHHLIDMFGDIGLGLGSQVSQISAVAYPSKIDKRIANHSYTESNGRYMDDGYAICRTKEQAIELAKILEEETKKLNIILNPKKVRIVKLSNIFVFLKKRIRLAEDGHVIMRLERKSFYKHERKMRKLLGLIDAGKLTYEDVLNTHKTWYGQVRKGYQSRMSIYNTDKKIRRMLDDYNEANTGSNQCGFSET